MTPILIRSRSSIFLESVRFWPCSFRTTIVSPRFVAFYYRVPACREESELITSRFCGHSRSGWNPSQSCLSCSCCSAPARPIRSLPTTCSLWECTERSTFQTGSTGTSRNLRSSVPFSRSLSLPALFRPCFTLTFSTSITTSKRHCSNEIVRLI